MGVRRGGHCSKKALWGAVAVMGWQRGVFGGYKGAAVWFGGASEITDCRIYAFMLEYVACLVNRL